MAKVPADRFHSATDFANALTDDEGAARRRRDSLRAKALVAETMERPALGRGRKKVGLIAAAVAVPLLAAGGWFALKNGNATPPEGLAGDYAKNNIAVMYFDDRSPGKQLQYLADGITESLINELSAVPQLKVISRNGVAPFKGKTVASDSIAKALKVGTLVSGKVTPLSGGRIRVEVELTDARSGDQKGSTRVELPQANVVDVQDSLARDMSVFLRRQVGEEIQQIVSRVGTRNPAAWDAMQHARQTLGEMDALVKARDIPAALQKVTEADAALAKVEALDSDWREPIIERAWLGFRAARLVPDGDPALVKQIDAGLAHAERALKKAPNDAAALEARGTLHYWQWLSNLSPEGMSSTELLALAEKDLTGATVADTRRASAWNALSHLRINKGQLAEAKLAAENAYKADPYLTDVDRTIQRLFFASLDLGIRDEAKKWYDEGQRRFPGSYTFTECKLWLYSLPGGGKPDMSEVWKSYDAYVKVSPATVQEINKLRGKMIVALAFLRAGQPDSAKALAAANLGDPQIDPRGDLTNYAATIYFQAGDKDRALELVAKWLAMNPQQRAFAAADKSWWLEGLRSDPRYQALVKSN